MDSRRVAGVVLVLLALGFSTFAVRAEDDDATREQKAGQLIFNALQMSNERGAPIAQLTAKFRRMGTTSAGVGYRGEQMGREGGSNFVCSPGVTFLNETGMALSLDQAAGQLGAVRVGSDRRTGATVYVQKDERGDADRILYLMRQGNVQLYMLIDRVETDAEEMTRRSIHRWRFLVDEAERLGIFQRTVPPQFVIRIWDPYLREWQTVENGQTFARRLARLHKEEALSLEVDVESEMLSGSQAYEFEIRVQQGEKVVSLREADAQTPLGDPDHDGWSEVRVEPVDGEHPPRRLTAVFAAESAGSHAYAQKATVAVRYADDSGEAQQQVPMARAIPSIVVAQLELLSTQQSAMMDLFLRGRSPEAAAAFRSSRLEPATWFNGVWDSGQDLQVSWEGALPTDLDLDPIPGLWDRLAVTGAPPNSQYATGTEYDNPYLGWARDLREGSAGTGFLVMEDRRGGPLEVGPFGSREPVNLYVEISIQEDLGTESGQGPAMGMREALEREIQVRKRLEIGSGRAPGSPFEISLWHVDDLEDLKDESGRISSFSEAAWPRIKEGLRKPTGKQVVDPSGSPRTLYTWQAGDSRVIDTFFPLSSDTIRAPLPFGGSANGQPLDLPAGIYELQFRLVLQDREVEEGEEYPETWTQHVALRFWVLDLPGIDEIRVLQGLDTERVPPRSQRRELRHEASDAALLSAAKSGDAAALSAAIGAGADVNAVDPDGAVPLGWAVSLGHEDAVRLLLEAGADVHHQTARGQSALNVAAARDDRALVRILLQAGADPNERVRGESAPQHLQGATPIFLAARQDRGEALEELVRAGADINATNALGGTVLHLEAEADDGAGVRRLLRLGADPKRADSRGVTPLMVAAHEGSVECVWLLVDQGADPNGATSAMNPGPFAGLTPLMAAAQGDQPAATVALLLSGARPDARNGEGKTALDLARAGGSKRVAEILERPREAKNVAVAVFMDRIKDAVDQGRWDFVKLLVAHGVDVNAPDKHGMPPLLAAVDHGEVEAVKGLLAVGADVDARDREYGATALMGAAFDGHLELVRTLIRAGAKVNLVARGDEKGESAGWTALMGAALTGNPEVVEALLEAGADAEIVNAEGRTALDMAQDATQGNKARVIQLLEGRGGGGK